jgi:hypothetical protein
VDRNTQELQAVLLNKTLEKTMAVIDAPEFNKSLVFALISDKQQQVRIMKQIDILYNLVKEAISIGHFQRASRFLLVLTDCIHQLKESLKNGRTQWQK